MNYTDGLNNDQIAVVENIDGAVRLIAGAGSGKTKVLTHRLANISDKKGIDPSRLLSITFTNNAANEMRERIATLMELPESSFNMMTFHQLGLEICKRDIEKLGYTKDFKIGSTAISILVSKYLDENPCSLVDEELQTFKRLLCKACTAALSDYKTYINMMTIPCDQERCDEQLILDYATKLAEEKDVLEKAKADFNKEFKKAGHSDSVAMTYYKAYYLGQLTQDIKDDFKKYNDLRKDFPQKTSHTVNPIITWVIDIMKMKQSLGTVSYDDLINFSLYLLETDEEVREYWQTKFDYIQVDEFQDTDSKQLDIVRYLYAKHGNLFVVGDPDQSIYLFRNAKPELFNNLGSYIPNLTTMYLTLNYRSSKEIVEVSNSVIKLNKNRIPKELTSFHGSMDKVQVITNRSLTDAENDILDEIIETANSNKLPQTRLIDIMGLTIGANNSIENNLKRCLQVICGESGKARKAIDAGAVRSKIIPILTHSATADKVVNEIQALIDNGVPTDEITILYRSKSDAFVEDVYLQLKEKQIPLDTQYTPKSVVRDLIEEPMKEYLKYYHTKDVSFLGAVVNGIIDTDSEGNTFEMNVPYNDLLVDIDIHNADAVLTYFLNIVPHLYKSGTDTPIGNFKKILDNYDDCLTLIENLVANFDDLSDADKDAMCSEDARINKDVKLGDGVHLMTMHASKGLEFNYVFVLGLVDGYFPKHGFGVSPIDGILTYEEEARLAYVAFSRAKKKLFLFVPNKNYTSSFVAQPIMDDVNKNITSNDKDFMTKIEKDSPQIVSDFFDAMTFNSWGDIQKIMLKVGDDVVGYRYKTVVHGQRIGFDALIQDVDAKKVKINGIKDENIIQAINVCDGHINTYEEQNNLIYVRTLNANDIDSTFNEVPNIITLYNNYFVAPVDSDELDFD